MVTPSPDNDISSFGIVLAIAFIGAVFAFSPTFLELSSASIGSDLLISVALALLLWAVVGFFSEIEEYGDIFQNEGWSNLLITAMLTLPPAIPFALVVVLDSAWWLETSLKVATLLLCLPLALSAAATVDSFFIKPRLRLSKSRSERRGDRTQRKQPTSAIVGGMAAVITWVLSNMVNLLVVLDQLFSGN